MASITSVISLFVLLLATYCYAVPIKFTTEKPMLGHDGTTMFMESTTFGHMMTGDKKVREERESASEEHTTDLFIKRDDESESKRTFEHFTVPSVELTTEMHKIRNMEESEEKKETRSFEDSEEKQETRRIEDTEEKEETRSMNGMTFTSVNPTTEMHQIRDIDEHSTEHDESSNKRTVEDISFPTSTSDSVEDNEEKRAVVEREEFKNTVVGGHEGFPRREPFRHEPFQGERFLRREFEDELFTTERVPHHSGEMGSELFTTERLPHHAREFEHDLSTKIESSTEFADRAIRGSPEWLEEQARAAPEWFEREARASPEWFERTARNYAEPEVEESKEEKVLSVKHISLDKTKTLEPSSSVDSYAKTTGLLEHEEIKPIEDSYTHVEKIVPGTFHETKFLHEEMPHKEVHVNDYETKVIHEVPLKDLLVKDYETVKPALDEVKVKTFLTKTESSY